MPFSLLFFFSNSYAVEFKFFMYKMKKRVLFFMFWGNLNQDLLHNNNGGMAETHGMKS